MTAGAPRARPLPHAARAWTLKGLSAATTMELLVAHDEQLAALRAAAAATVTDRQRMRLATRVCHLRGELRRRGALRIYPNAPEPELL